jgi:tetratricopeptide (TPR) repeat protein
MNGHMIALKALIRQRHLSYEAFCRDWDRVARSADDALTGRYPGRAQYYRWLRGELANNRPYPDACRMLEAMFPGWPVESLFSEYTGEIPQPAGAGPPGAGIARRPSAHGIPPPETRPDAGSGVEPLIPERYPVAIPILDDMNRRELLRIMSIAGAMAAAGSVTDGIDWERIGSSNDAGRLDSAAIDDLGALDNHLWRVFVLSRAKQSVLPLVRDHLHLLTDSIPKTGSISGYRRLCGYVSSAFQLCGEILFDANLYTEAAHCYLLAATAGKEAGINDLWACALTRHSFINMYEQRFDKAAPLLELAAGLARHGDQSLATRHWISAVQAQAFAGLGEFNACQRALESAGAVHELSGSFQNGGWLRFDGSRLAEESGTCYVRLRRFDLAESALTEALSHSLSPRRRGSVLTDLAILSVQRNNIERTITLAETAAQLIQQTGSGYIARKLITLQPYLLSFLNDTRMRNLNDQITQLEAQISAE